MAIFALLMLMQYALPPCRYNKKIHVFALGTWPKPFDNDNDVYFTLATSDSRIGKYKTENN